MPKTSHLNMTFYMQNLCKKKELRHNINSFLRKDYFKSVIKIHFLEFLCSTFSTLPFSIQLFKTYSLALQLLNISIITLVSYLYLAWKQIHNGIYLFVSLPYVYPFVYFIHFLFHIKRVPGKASSEAEIFQNSCSSICIHNSEHIHSLIKHDA